MRQEYECRVVLRDGTVETRRSISVETLTRHVARLAFSAIDDIESVTIQKAEPDPQASAIELLRRFKMLADIGSTYVAWRDGDAQTLQDILDFVESGIEADLVIGG